LGPQIGAITTFSTACSLLGNCNRLAHKESLVPVLGKWGKGKEESGTKNVNCILTAHMFQVNTHKYVIRVF
jgi:hypothetical protein